MMRCAHALGMSPQPCKTAVQLKQTHRLVTPEPLQMNACAANAKCFLDWDTQPGYVDQSHMPTWHSSCHREVLSQSKPCCCVLMRGCMATRYWFTGVILLSHGAFGDVWVTNAALNCSICILYWPSYMYNADNTLKPLVEELMLFPTNTAYRSMRACNMDLELSHANKGVESIQYYDAGEQGMF